MSRTPIIAGNWKMFKTIAEAKEFAMVVTNELQGVTGADMVVCAPFTALAALRDALTGSNLLLGAQNVHFAEEGAYTGEISPRMLTELGVRYVIIGHSERRAYFNETDETVNKKVHASLKHSLIPIICVGEDLDQREAGQTFTIVEEQTRAAIAGVAANQAAELVIAYEPIWAIGTGKSSTAQDANEVIGHIRKTLAHILDQETANRIRIQYGGSVKPDNIGEFLAQTEIDGALVGGASLVPDSYVGLVRGAVTKEK
ncbi:triose-phosphate isomerase [Effusibacillus lacus]|uniref:Triosephosphate isomerase n=1 Tax=Effusibacillus lacus TaxID=1348429 RepID=A0A292YQJ3_9BACL|nr:triose-phosphate isomerase [Effusibacillus lacus]TCS74228.1 triosephosphate isomerase [Effusibacillus lacus]GAX90775.1 triose-phosphate isomerase [Effusibacillus lacus]